MRRRAAALVALMVALAGCGGDEDPARQADDAPRGGTLTVGITENPFHNVLETLDPGINYEPPITEVFRCCLQRTLLNYRGGTTEEGGAILRPDLAVALPQASQDGLTYTFRLRQGLRYSPPYDDVTVKAQDIVRAVEYALRLGPQYYTDTLKVIEGAEAFQKRKADTITGLETPDERTVVVHLTERVGDVGERFALFLRLGRIVRDNLEPLGIELDVKTFDPETYFSEVLERPERRVPLIPALGWAPDTLNAASVFPLLFHGPRVGQAGGNTLSQVGASPAQLREWKYAVTRVLNIDGTIEACVRLTAAAQIRCWAETDQLLMERVVPWVPYLFEGTARPVSDRIARFAFTQASYTLVPALDRIVLKPGST